jgi:hypothetical protein
MILCINHLVTLAAVLFFEKQGFSYLLLFGSYIALAIVLTIKIYVSTENPINSGLAFLGFLFLGVFMVALVRQTA